MLKQSKTKERLLIIGPPVLLLLIGAAIYIAVLKLAEPPVQTIEALPQDSPSQSTAPAQTSQTAVLTSIITDVTKPSSNEIRQMQAAADAKTESWRTDMLSAAKRLAEDYGFKTTDSFSLQTTASALAKTNQVVASHAGRSYLITMSQPGVTGVTGIWIIESIKAD